MASGGNQPSSDSSGQANSQAGESAGEQKSSWLTRTLRIIKYLALAAALLLLLLSAVLATLLAKPNGRVWLVTQGLEQANQRLSDLHIDIQGLSSPRLGHWRFHSLQIEQRGNPLLMARDGEVLLDLDSLWQRRLHLPAIRAGYLSLDLTHPSADTNAKSEPANGEHWPIQVDELYLKDLQLALPPELFAAPAGSPLADLNQLQARVKMSFGKDGNHISTKIADLSVNLWRHSFVLQAQADYNAAIDHFALVSSSFKIDDQPQQLFATWDRGRLNVDIKLQQLPLDIAQFWVPQLNSGFASGELQVKGRWPEVHASFNQSAQLNMQYQGQNWPISLQAKGEFGDRKLSLTEAVVLLKDAQASAAETLAVGASSASDNKARNKSLSKKGLGSKEVRIALSGSYQMALDSVGELAFKAGELDAKLNVANLNQDWIVFAAGLAGTELPERWSLALPEFAIQIRGPVVGAFTGDYSQLKLQSQFLAKAQYQSSAKQPVSVAGAGNPNETATQEKAASSSAATTELTLRSQLAGTVSRLQVKQFALASGDTSLDLTGMLDPQGERNQLQLQIKRFNLKLLRDLDLALPDKLEGAVTGEVQLKGALRKPQLVVNARGDLNYPLQTQSGSWRDEALQVNLEGSWQNQIATIEKLQLVRAQTADKPLLQLQGQARLSESAAKKIPAMNWHLQSEGFPMAIVAPYGWPDANGNMSADLTLATESAAQVSASWMAAAKLSGELTYRSQLLVAKKPPREIEWRARITSAETADGNATSDVAPKLSENSQPSKGEVSSRWQIDAEVFDRTEQNPWQQRGSLRLATNTGSIYSLLEQDTASDQIALPELSLNANFDLDAIQFLLPPEQRVGGRLQTQLLLAGDWPKPNINGSLQLSDGVYVNSTLGRGFSDIRFDSRIFGSHWRITGLHLASDNGGVLDGRGDIRWDQPASEDAVDISINASRFNFIERREVSGEIGGQLRLKGSLRDLLLSGDLSITPLDISIAENPGPTIAEIDYQFAASEEELAAEAESSWVPNLRIELNIRADQQAFIRGRGLDAELQGGIQLSGTLQALEYEGVFKTLRGRFEVFGKKFDLTQGEVGFSNQSAVFLVTGVHQKGDTKITAEISGTAEKFNLKLSSVPAMPEDEILARLIFGKSVQQITPIQAVQLALAVQTLRGGGGFDPLAETRKLLNVDSVSVDSDERGMSLGIGKYLSEDVYLELERSSDPAHPWRGKVLIELTPSISLETTTGGSGSQGGSATLLWRRDY
jgi:Uncharacterized protein conserved in bacteria